MAAGVVLLLFSGQHEGFFIIREEAVLLQEDATRFIDAWMLAVVG